MCSQSSNIVVVAAVDVFNSVVVIFNVGDISAAANCHIYNKRCNHSRCCCCF